MKKIYRGFTLVEIMIVVLIIGILVSIAIPNFTRARESARTKSCARNIKTLNSAMEQYKLDNKTNYFSSAQLDLLVPTYIKSKPFCPSGGVTSAIGPWTYSVTADSSDLSGASHYISCSGGSWCTPHNEAAGVPD